VPLIGAFDWRDDATCYGPFDSYEEANPHLTDNHANPGGHSIEAQWDLRMDDLYKTLIADAVARFPK